MTDFAAPYRGVQHFGIWADETADDYGRRDAVDVLAQAVDQCRDEDMRNDAQVIAALHYLTAIGWHKAARRFRMALNIEQPDERRQAAADAYAALIR